MTKRGVVGDPDEAAWLQNQADWARVRRLLETSHEDFMWIKREIERLGRERDEARQRAERAEAEQTELAQAMWRARSILGFDNDGEETAQAMIAGMGWEGFRAAFLRDMQQQREDYEAALEEIPFDS